MIKPLTLNSGSCDTPGQLRSLGAPTRRNILFSWSSTSLPGNSGLPEFDNSINKEKGLVKKEAVA